MDLGWLTWGPEDASMPWLSDPSTKQRVGHRARESHSVERNGLMLKKNCEPFTQTGFKVFRRECSLPHMPLHPESLSFTETTLPTPSAGPGNPSQKPYQRPLSSKKKTSPHAHIESFKDHSLIQQALRLPSAQPEANRKWSPLTDLVPFLVSEAASAQGPMRSKVRPFSFGVPELASSFRGQQ